MRLKFAKPANPWPYEHAYKCTNYSSRTYKFASYGLAELVYGVPKIAYTQETTLLQDEDGQTPPPPPSPKYYWYVTQVGDTQIIPAEGITANKYPIFYGVRRPHPVYMHVYCIGIIDDSPYYWLFNYTSLMHSGWVKVSEPRTITGVYPKCTKEHLAKIKEGALEL